MKDFVFKYIKSATQDQNNAANKIIRDVFFLSNNTSTSDRFDHLECIIKGAKYVVTDEYIRKIINIIINNVPNIVETNIFYRNDEYMVKYYRRNLRKMIKIFLQN